MKTVAHFRFGRTQELSIKGNWEWKLLCKVVQNVDKAVFLDFSSFNTMLKNGYKNVCILPNPIAPKVLEIIKQNMYIKRVPRQILFVGHCISTKGIYELVHVCQYLHNIHLKLVGSIDDRVKQGLLKLVDNDVWLEITGEKEYHEIIKDMLQCSVFVLPTYTEGFPNVILEAMACGCPIVTTDVGAIPDMLNIESNEKCGICIKPKNENSLRKAIETMLADSDLAHFYGNNARKRVLEEYSMPMVWHKLIGIYRDIM